jgi:hypothetical protein
VTWVSVARRQLGGYREATIVTAKWRHPREEAMKPLARTFAVLVVPWSAALAADDCNRLEYLSVDSSDWVTHCEALGFPSGRSPEVACTEEKWAMAKAGVDWVLFENAAALEAYRASVSEQITCGYPPISLTHHRALLVSVKAHHEGAECMIADCDFKITGYLHELEEQGKLPKD